MKKEFLGDAFDHWKGSLIKLLSVKGLVKNLVVEPMITDEQAWSNEDLETYGRLLRVEWSSLTCHGQSTFSGKREKYFDQLPDDGDLFLDPDTGVATGSVGRKHVKASELGRLLARWSDRVLMVYQHAPQGSSLHERLCKIRDTVSRDIPDVHCAAYAARQVAMLFISLNGARTKEICDALKEHLRGTAESRILYNTARHEKEKHAACW